MGILKHFLNPKEYEVTRGSMKTNNVVSVIKKENRSIEKRLSACMKEIQQSMKQRKLVKPHAMDKILVKTSLRSV